jgi:hypothetical protein
MKIKQFSEFSASAPPARFAGYMPFRTDNFVGLFDSSAPPKIAVNTYKYGRYQNCMQSENTPGALLQSKIQNFPETFW